MEMHNWVNALNLDTAAIEGLRACSLADDFDQISWPVAYLRNLGRKKKPCGKIILMGRT